MSFGSRLREARKAKGLRQVELSIRCGLSKSVVSNYEVGISYPNIETLYKLCELLEVDPNYLLFDDLSDELKKKISKKTKTVSKV